MRPAGVIKVRDLAFAIALAFAFALASFAAKEVRLASAALAALGCVFAATFAGASLTRVPFALAVGTSRARACFPCTLGRRAEKGRVSSSEAVPALEGPLGSGAFAFAFGEGVQGPGVGLCLLLLLLLLARCLLLLVPWWSCCRPRVWRGSGPRIHGGTLGLSCREAWWLQRLRG
jgi:hypothetical protein